ncbi:Golgi resident protein GCP60, partial [Bulinus truncatus]
MASTSSQNIVNGVEKLDVSDDDVSNKSTASTPDDVHREKWGFSLEDVFKIALKFFKEKEGKALQLTYQSKLKLVALSKQATFGKFRPDLFPDVGFLDVVGNDRRQAWQSLGDMSKEAAMAEFVQKMADSCSLFQPYVEAHRAEKEEAERKQKEEEEKLKQEEEEKKKKEMEETARLAQEAEKKKQQEQELQIRAALNQQTQAQFRQYAEQQYPNNKTMQDELIHQLQDQHFQQYMQQVYQQQLLQQQQQNSTTPIGDTNGNSVSEHVKAAASPIPDGVTPISPCGDDEEAAITSVPKIVPASLWTRKDLKEFKDGLRSSKENVVRIGSLATAT